MASGECVKNNLEQIHNKKDGWWTQCRKMMSLLEKNVNVKVFY